MYVSELRVQNFRQFGEGANALQLRFQPGVTALVGRNDSGKSTVIDAIRYALLTRDQEFLRVQPEDFHINKAGNQASEINIVCTLAGLTDVEKGVFIEYLSYHEDDVVLHINWTARKLNEKPGTRRWVDLSVRSGIDGVGPSFESAVRQLLSAAYLRPLRDAEREMSPGRGSRLSQILSNVSQISDGKSFDPSNMPEDTKAVAELGLVGLTDYMRHNIQNHSGINYAQKTLNEKYLTSLSLSGDSIQGRIDVSEGGTETARLRQILERLELGLFDAKTQSAMGCYGLGSNNLLFIACELLLLGREPEGLPLLMIEEPEAHLHPQRQLRLMEFLRQTTLNKIEAGDRNIQVILSTHSPNLASKIPLENLILLEGRCAFSLAKGLTNLEVGDYRFLERFLDVTKANLFFAHGLLIVEGDAEAILLPTIARLIGKDLTENGVSVVNVGSTGLRRFSRIFQRSEQGTPTMGIPVACIADMDVMPDCAPAILGLVQSDDDERWTNPKRRWRVNRDFGADVEKRKIGLAERRERLQANDGQSVKTFVSDHWTFEYDLARCGLAELVYVAAHLAKNDDPLNEERKKSRDVITEAKENFKALQSQVDGDEDVFCSHVYSLFKVESVSKAIAAQYLSELLQRCFKAKKFTNTDLRAKLPPYLVAAIDYVTDLSTEEPDQLSLL